MILQVFRVQLHQGITSTGRYLLPLLCIFQNFGRCRFVLTDVCGDADATLTCR